MPRPGETNVQLLVKAISKLVPLGRGNNDVPDSWYHKWWTSLVLQ